MSNHHEYTEYEASDIDLRWVAYTLIGLIILLIVSILVLKPLFGYKNADHYLIENNVANPQRANFKVDEKFPEPRLQWSPPLDMKIFRAQETEYLSSYAWVDQQNDIARIPIDVAIDLYLQQNPGMANPNGGSKAPK